MVPAVMDAAQARVKRKQDPHLGDTSQSQIQLDPGTCGCDRLYGNKGKLYVL
jgi:hypothetical protein